MLAGSHKHRWQKQTYYIEQYQGYKLWGAVKLAETIIIDDNKRKLLLSEEVFVNDSTLAQYLEKERTGCVKIMEIIRIAVRYDNGM